MRGIERGLCECSYNVGPCLKNWYCMLSCAICNNKCNSNYVLLYHNVIRTGKILPGNIKTSHIHLRFEHQNIYEPHILLTGYSPTTK